MKKNHGLYSRTVLHQIHSYIPINSVPLLSSLFTGLISINLLIQLTSLHIYLTMAEAVGLAVSLASLCSSCIECFEYIHVGQSFPVESEILLEKLDIEKTRLLVWGEAMELFQLSSLVSTNSLKPNTPAQLSRQSTETRSENSRDLEVSTVPIFLVCVDTSRAQELLGNCEACRYKNDYRSYDDAVAHLCRFHSDNRPNKA